jgi:carboxyl-terminal processing protease
VVYGGGGILPDILVEQDTSGNSAYLKNIRSHNLMSRFAFHYTDQHRKQLLDFEDVRILDRHFMVTDDVMKEFIAYADSNGVAFDEAGYENSKEHMAKWIKAFVADNLWGNRGLYPMLYQDDDDVQAAIRLLDVQRIAALEK